METWCLSQEDSYKLKLFKRKVIRRIYGAKRVNGEWKIKRTNNIETILEKNNILNCVKAIKSLA